MQYRKNIPFQHWKRYISQSKVAITTFAIKVPLFRCWTPNIKPWKLNIFLIYFPRWKAIFFVLCYSCCITSWAIEPTNILFLICNELYENIFLTGLSIFTTWISEINIYFVKVIPFVKAQVRPLAKPKKMMTPVLIVKKIPPPL